MKKKISKKFIILSISSALVLITTIVLACAGGDDFADYFNSFFAPETSNAPASKPFFRSVHTFYGGGENFYDNYESNANNIHVMDAANIEDWKAFFSGKVATDDLKYIVYKSRIGEIDTCIFYLKNNTYPIKDYLKNNTLIKYEDKAIVKEFLFYQGFAKRCEPFATFEKEWWIADDNNDPRKDLASMQLLISGGQKSLQSDKTPFIKQRYAFQIIRMMYQAGMYKESEAFFNKNSTLLLPENTIYYRALGYLAASKYKLGNFSEANYLYSIIYDNCDLMKKSSYLSFHPQDEYDWQGALNLAKTQREKEVLWHMLGIYVDPLRAMTEIYKLNPKSDLLDLLLVRTVNISEEGFIRYQSYWGERANTLAFNTENVDAITLDFIQKVANTGNTLKPYLWNLAAGYLNLINGNYKGAETYFANTESSVPRDNLVAEQIRAFRLISTVEQYAHPDIRSEEKLFNELSWIGNSKHHPALRQASINSWVLSRLSEKYFSWGDTVKAQCLDNNRNNNFYNTPKNVDDLILLMDKPTKTNFETYILSVYPYQKPTLINYKAIALIYQYKFEAALAMLDITPEAGSAELPADPFIIHINDCHDCDFAADKDKVYTNYTFLKRLVELQKKAETDPKKAADYYFQLANGLYNMTFFGNAHDLFASPIINIQVGYMPWGSESTEISTYPSLFDCSKAMEYYEKAMNASTDNEFKAKCCFMAAKCEQNQYYISKTYANDVLFKNGNYFKQLKNNFSKTRYYQEVINECGYFNKFALKK